MARRKFHFDFNEDAEPVEELHRFRAAVAEHFKTLEAVMEYIHSAPTAEEFLAQCEDEKKKKALQKTAARRRAKPAAKPQGKRKPVARAVHA